MNRTRFSGVLFDCDGVLVDSEPLTNGVLREMLHELGWSITEQDCVRMFIGRALKDQWPVILAHTGVRIDDSWIAAFRERRDAVLRQHLLAIPGAYEAVKVASRVFRGNVACATGADLAKATMQLEMTGIAPLFGTYVFSGMDQPRSKPAPDVYLAAAAALGIDPAEALVVEDTVSGVIAGGVAAGATAIGFSSGEPTSTAAGELFAAGASFVCSSMHEVAEKISALA